MHRYQAFVEETLAVCIQANRFKRQRGIRVALGLVLFAGLAEAAVAASVLSAWQPHEMVFTAERDHPW